MTVTVCGGGQTGAGAVTVTVTVGTGGHTLVSDCTKTGGVTGTKKLEVNVITLVDRVSVAVMTVVTGG